MFQFKSKLFARKYTFSVIRTITEKKLRDPAMQLKKRIVKGPKEILKEYGYGYGNKLIYNSKIEQIKIKSGYASNYAHQAKKNMYRKKLQHILETTQPLPLTLKYYSEEEIPTAEEKTDLIDLTLEEIISKEVENSLVTENKSTHFPLDITYPIEHNTPTYDKKPPMLLSRASVVDNEIKQKYDLLKKTKNWMTSYDNYEHDLEETDDDEVEDFTVDYGTTDPNSEISSVACGGCGAFLHCKDSGVPGYIPSEIFKNHKKKGGASLKAIICQRCFFLKEHNLALEVQVSSEDYPKVLMTIKQHKALVIVMVDLTDFPCSIWPGIADILGPHTPIMVVGNKIDLIPKDDERYLSHVKNKLCDNMKLFGFGSMRMLDICLISAKTGYGIEDLITKIHSNWKYRGDIYLVGCTNVGKSSLFNALLRSDLCKSQAQDLIQRATTSLWPGTTLNLLKFPILKPSQYRIYLRNLRMRALKKLSAKEDELRSAELKNSNSIEHATLIGHIGQTFPKKIKVNEETDTIIIPDTVNNSGRNSMGIDENHFNYALSKWCFDTPGVIQPDQILNILTVDELMYVIPRDLIRPQTFILKPGMTLFIAGLARLDYVEGEKPVRLTVFRSKELPITVCINEAADDLYNDLLGTDFFKVPINESERLSNWPRLELGKIFTVTGVNFKESTNDVVLSNAGWIAINCMTAGSYKFQAWTPEKRGIFVRDCLLPKAIGLRGNKIRNSVAYKENKFI